MDHSERISPPSNHHSASLFPCHNSLHISRYTYLFSKMNLVGNCIALTYITTFVCICVHCLSVPSSSSSVILLPLKYKQKRTYYTITDCVEVLDENTPGMSKYPASREKSKPTSNLCDSLSLQRLATKIIKIYWPSAAWWQ